MRNLSNISLVLVFVLYCLFFRFCLQVIEQTFDKAFPFGDDLCRTFRLEVEGEEFPEVGGCPVGKINNYQVGVDCTTSSFYFFSVLTD